MGTVTKVCKYDSYMKIYIKNPVFHNTPHRGIILTFSSGCPVEKGDVIETYADIKEFRQATCEGEFDEKAYYNSIGYYYKAYISDLRVVNKATRFQHFLNGFKERLEGSYYAIDMPNAGIYDAMIVGDKTELDKDIKDMYVAAGIAHILAISGLHIAIIGMGLFKMLKRWGLNYVSCMILSITLIFAYGNITDNSISTIRALVMFSIYAYGNVLGKVYDILSAACICMIFILIENPYMLNNSGFQLSFLSIFAISKVSNIVLMDSKRVFVNSLVLGASITAMTLPVVAYNYFEFSPYSILLNLIVIPLMTIFMVGAVLGGLLGMFNTFIGSFFIGISHYILKIYDALCHINSILPYAGLLVGRPYLWTIIIYYLVLFISLIMFRRSKLQIRVAGFFISLLLGVIVLSYRDDRSFVYMIDVSQGESVYVKAGKSNLLFDCGSSDIDNVGKYRIIPYLKSNKVSSLDYIILSHLDADHVNALEDIIKSDIDVKAIIVNYELENDEKMIELKNLADKYDKKVLFVKAYDIFENNEYKIQFIIPPNNYKVKDDNSKSLIAMLTVMDNKILFTGDASNDEINNTPDFSLFRDINILIVPHHGSKYSANEKLLIYAKPDIALISCGYNNSYGHPHKETLDLLSKNMIETHITSLEGSVKIMMK